MAVIGKLAVTKRTEHGSRECSRLRDRGFVPGNMYGHKQENVALTVTASDLLQLIKAGSRVLDLEIEGRDVLIVEDFIDSGLTLSYLLKNLRSRKPASRPRPAPTSGTTSGTNCGAT